MLIAVSDASLNSQPRRVAELARGLGFDGILFDLVSADLDLTELSDTGLREFRHVVTRNGVALAGLQADLGPRGMGPGADVDRLLEQCSKVFDAARKLQATVVCLEIGALPEPPVAAPPRRPTQDEAGMILLPSFEAVVPSVVDTPRPANPAMEARVDSAMFELGRLADRYAVNVALRSDLASLAALQRTLAAARCPWFGVDLNPVAVLRDDWVLDEVFARLGTSIRHVRGRDAVAGEARRTKPMPIGLGDTQWGELLDDLTAVDYRGWITMDPVDLLDRSAAAVKGMSYLRLHQD